jgi:hypothetical protein
MLWLWKSHWQCHKEEESLLTSNEILKNLPQGTRIPIRHLGKLESLARLDNAGASRHWRDCPVNARGHVAQADRLLPQGGGSP